ncbi:hypothetical protein B0J11DRAFT_517262 [Dendryphion nanum]|uniref:Uncharacterized protein n=1 Tax=Dendryphion nanum TaxID=256645 RepID=A0A9P9E9C0_9PLEO|nr:hypothetical protein B0J11DRAFT_517262 [Dendryphion nanum]
MLLDIMTDCFMILKGTSAAYGMIGRHTDPMMVLLLKLRGDAVHPILGLQVLQIQRYNLHFLLAWSLEILHDIPHESLFGNQFPICTEIPRLAQDSMEYRSMSITAMESPYRVPTTLDFPRLQTLVTARIGALEDHIWALREDPGYFSETYDSYENHCALLTRDFTGKLHPLPGRSRVTISNYILRSLVLDGYYMLLHWKECHRQLVALEKIEVKLHHVLCSGERPVEYFEAFANLRFLFSAISTDAQTVIQRGAPTSPPLQSFFQREEAADSRYMQFLCRDAPKKDGNVVGQCVRVIQRIWASEEPPSCGFRFDLDELDRLLEKDERARKLITPYIASGITQMSVAAECTHQIKLSKFWTEASNVEFDLNEEAILCNYLKLTSRFKSMTGNQYLRGEKCARLGDPKSGKFHYPILKRASQEVVDQMRTAEKNLDLFWEAMDAYCVDEIGNTLTALLDWDITHGRQIRRTPPWVPPLENVGGGSVKTKLQEPEYRYHDFSRFGRRYDQSSDTTRPHDSLRLSVATKPAKIKTRGTAILPEDVKNAADHAVASTDESIFHVDRRSYKVFKALFYSNYVTNDIPGEIPWLDFVRAMIATGFTAEKLQGSAWQFTLQSSGVERAIQFHEPHPESKIPLTIARRHGRRLNRAYGWEGHMFHLA